MDIGDKERRLLVDLFNRCHEQNKWVSAKRFSVEHADALDIIENLKRKDLIHWDSGTDTYRIKIRVFLLIEDDLLNETLYVVERVFNALRDMYIEEPGRGGNIENLCMQLKLSREQLVEALLYLKEITPFSVSPDLESDDAVVIPSQAFVKYAGFNAIIDEQVGYLDSTSDLPEESKRLRSNQKAKLLSQAVAKTLWDIYPDMTIEAMCDHPSIQEYGAAKSYDKAKTVKKWLTEVAPEHVRKQTGTS